MVLDGATAPIVWDTRSVANVAVPLKFDIRPSLMDHEPVVVQLVVPLRKRGFSTGLTTHGCSTTDAVRLLNEQTIRSAGCRVKGWTRTWPVR